MSPALSTVLSEVCCLCQAEATVLVRWWMSQGEQVGSFCRPCMKVKAVELNRFHPTYEAVEVMT